MKKGGRERHRVEKKEEEAEEYKEENIIHFLDSTLFLSIHLCLVIKSRREKKKKKKKRPSPPNESIMAARQRTPPFSRGL